METKTQTKEDGNEENIKNEGLSYMPSSDERRGHKIPQKIKGFVKNTYDILVASATGTVLIYLMYEYIATITSSDILFIFYLIGIIPFLCGFFVQLLPSTDRFTIFERGCLAGWLSNMLITVVLLNTAVQDGLSLVLNPLYLIIVILIVLLPILLGGFGSYAAKWIQDIYKNTNI